MVDNSIMYLVVLIISSQNNNLLAQNGGEDPSLERRLDEIITGLQSYIRKHLLERTSRTNASIIIDYIEELKSEANPKDYTK
jgi:hypothetical protein